MHKCWCSVKWKDPPTHLHHVFQRRNIELSNYIQFYSLSLLLSPWCSIRFIKYFFSCLCRDQACPHPAVWLPRGQPWAPQGMVTVRCLGPLCLGWWIHLGRGLPRSRFSRSSSRIATSSKLDLSLIAVYFAIRGGKINKLINRSDLQDQKYLCCSFVWFLHCFSFSTKKKKMADKILPQRVIISYYPFLPPICPINAKLAAM